MSRTNEIQTGQELAGADVVPLSFLLAGFSKCGTTTLHSLLCEHPELYLPSKPHKEPWFFSHNFERGWLSYRQHFDDAYRGQKLGEASTSYSTYRREVPSRRRILRHYPNIKLLFIARDPVDRIESAFRETHHSGAVWGTFCPFRLDRALHRLPVFLNDSSFNLRLQNYARFVDESNIHIVLLEELKSDPSGVLRSCFEFLDVDPDVPIRQPDRRMNAGSEKLRDSMEMRRMRSVIWHPETGNPLERISAGVADQFLKPMGFRKPIQPEMLEWSREARSLVVDTLFEDACEFLNRIDKPLSVWPRLETFSREQGLTCP